MLFDNLNVSFGSYEETYIDFDFDPGGVPLLDGAVVNATYAAWGVNFSAMPVPQSCGLEDFIYANDNQPVGFGSPPNVVTTCHGSAASDISENVNGIVRADFDRPACEVCIDVHVSQSPYQAIFRAYGATGGVIATTESAPGAIETICVSAPSIYGVSFSGKDDLWARFDNLRILHPFSVVDVPLQAPRSHLRLRGVFPNPATRDIRVAISLPSAGPAKLQLVDISGRIVISESLDGFTPGDHTIEINPGETLSRGVYFVRLSQGLDRKTSKVVFLP
jgi:hypothetical protein